MFPQLSSVLPVIDGKQFFRLKTELLSAGDLYESEVSALGFAMGPDSDLSSVNISYLDEEQTPQLLTSANLTPDRNLVGRIDARNDVQYKGPGQRPGRILINSNDLWDPSLRPFDYDAAGGGEDLIEFIRPTLDVLQYFRDVPSVAPPRSDKSYRFEYYQQAPGAQGVTWLAIPAYGRKSGSFTFNNRNAVDTVRVTVYGWKLQTTTPSATSTTASLFTDDLLSTDTAVFQYSSLADGLWDILLIALGGATAGFKYINTSAFPTTVVLSDDPL